MEFQKIRFTLNADELKAFYCLLNGFVSFRDFTNENRQIADQVKNELLMKIFIRVLQPKKKNRIALQKSQALMVENIQMISRSFPTYEFEVLRFIQNEIRKQIL